MPDSATLLRLFGTEDPVPPIRIFRAGRLSAELEGGQVRSVRFDDIELLRGIAFLVRTDSWATLVPVLTDFEAAQDADGFRVNYNARAVNGTAAVTYNATVEASSAGHLRFTVRAVALDLFRTNRTGFVILHGAQVAGYPVDVELTDGRRQHTVFPTLIDPVQPMRDLRAISHEAAPGLRVTVRMEGDTFEMEDQRNWTDASFKTYCRPLELPWPYEIAPGEAVVQSVHLTAEVARFRGTSGRRSTPAAIMIDPNRHCGTAPIVGLGCTPEEAVAGAPHAPVLRSLGIGALVCRYDPGRGHEPEALRRYAALADAIGARAELQIVVQAAEAAEGELRAVAAAVRGCGLRPARVFVVWASDMRSAVPGQTAPPCPPLPLLYRAARAAFPEMTIGGGSFCGFTELNRKRPPLDDIEAVTFSTSAIIHAADDQSVMETLEALPAVMASARAIAGGREIVVGPSAIGLRDNPAAADPLPNPCGIRLPMSGFDPRQRGQFNAAWSLGAIAAFAYGGAARIALSAPAGDFGILANGAPLPVAPVLAWCGAITGSRLFGVRCTPGLVAIASQDGRECAVLIANTSAVSQSISVRVAVDGGPTIKACLEPYETRRIMVS